MLRSCAAVLLVDGLTGLSALDNLKWKTSRKPKPKPVELPSVAFYLKFAGGVAVVAAGVGVYLYFRVAKAVKQITIRRQSLLPNTPIGDRIETVDGGCGCKYRVLMYPSVLGPAPTASISVTWVHLVSGTRTRTMCHEETVTTYFIVKGHGHVTRDSEAAHIKTGDSVIVRPNSRHHLVARSQDLVFLMIADPAVPSDGYDGNFARKVTQASDALITAMSDFVAAGSQSTQRIVQGAVEMRENYTENVSKLISTASAKQPK